MWLYKSILGLTMTKLMWKALWRAVITTAKFLRGSVVSSKARPDLAQLTPLPSDNI